MARSRLSETVVKNEFGKQLVEWMELECHSWGQKVLIAQDDAEGFIIRIYTSEYMYTIHASKSSRRDWSGYLGGYVTERSALPGKLLARGSDFPDGDFSRETLIRILCAIVFCEAKEVVKKVESADDDEKC